MDSLLKKRRETHGDYQEQFRVAQELKEVLHTYEWNKLSDVQREALEMICTKISRIIVGDCSHVDHWNDLAGYALRVVDSLKRFSDA